MAKYSQGNIRKMLRDSDKAPTSDKKGEILESLIIYLFTKMKGIELLERNFMDCDRTQEIDVALWNDVGQSELPFLEAVILVECKNTTKPISSNDVSWFLRKLTDRGTGYGILVSLNGISGSSDENSHAHSIIQSSLIRDKIKLLLINRDEVLNLKTTEDLSRLLRGKLTELILRRAIT